MNNTIVKSWFSGIRDLESFADCTFEGPERFRATSRVAAQRRLFSSTV